MTPLEIGFYSGCISLVHCAVLPNSNTPLNFLYKWLAYLQDKAPMIADPLGGCSLCFGGQVALWSSIFINGGYSYHDIFIHLSSAAVGITFAFAINTAHEWMIGNR